MSKAQSADPASYRCSACHGDEDWGPNHPIRGRAKSRSLSASPALASTKEFRYKALPQPPPSAARSLGPTVTACVPEQLARLPGAPARDSVPFLPLSASACPAFGFQGMWVAPEGTAAGPTRWRGWHGAACGRRGVGQAPWPGPRPTARALAQVLEQQLPTGRPAGPAVLVAPLPWLLGPWPR